MGRTAAPLPHGATTGLEAATVHATWTPAFATQPGDHHHPKRGHLPPHSGPIKPFAAFERL